MLANPKSTAVAAKGESSAGKVSPPLYKSGWNIKQWERGLLSFLAQKQMKPFLTSLFCMKANKEVVMDLQLNEHERRIIKEGNDEMLKRVKMNHVLMTTEKDALKFSAGVAKKLFETGKQSRKRKKETTLIEEEPEEEQEHEEQEVQEEEEEQEFQPFSTPSSSSLKGKGATERMQETSRKLKQAEERGERIKKNAQMMRDYVRDNLNETDKRSMKGLSYFLDPMTAMEFGENDEECVHEHLCPIRERLMLFEIESSATALRRHKAFS